jgi:hypothetical protein
MKYIWWRRKIAVRLSADISGGPVEAPKGISRLDKLYCINFLDIIYRPATTKELSQIGNRQLSIPFQDIIVKPKADIP